MDMKLAVVILAAGQGSRMHSAIPKVLHEIAGRPLLHHVIDAARELQPEQIMVVHRHTNDLVQNACPDPDLTWVEQEQPQGTGHAVQCALSKLAEQIDRVLVLYGDVPLIQPATLKSLLEKSVHGLGLLTLTLDDPNGYGRIKRTKSGRRVLGIVEQKDANPDDLKICEVNTGIMVLPVDRISDWLSRLSRKNSQNEYYLTDIVAMAADGGVSVQVAQPQQAIEAAGVNNRQQLAQLERAKQQMQADSLMLAGVTLQDPDRFDLSGQLHHGQDCTIAPNVVCEGEVTLGNRVRIGANTVLRNVQIEDDTVILENCVLEDTLIGPGSRIGPFARLRPGSKLARETRVGNFVEIKNSRIGPGSKLNHLAYVGDSQIGREVNLGAGSITCNYDGADKHKTVIGDHVFVGSNSALVAPIEIGQGATIGAGSVLNRYVPANALTLTRGQKKTIPDWVRPQKAGKKG